jgi:hypothetical protein
MTLWHALATVSPMLSIFAGTVGVSVLIGKVTR